MTKKPLIAIIMDEDTSKGGRFYEANKGYFNAIYAAGGVPIGIPYFKEAGEFALANCDGLMSTGARVRFADGAYIDGEQSNSPDSDRYEFESELVKKWVDADRPYLGICNGMQVLGVAYGAKMTFQLAHHLKTAINHNLKETLHKVKIVPDTQFAQMIGVQEVVTNSHHNEGFLQASDDVIFSAFAEDGAVEALEIKGKKFAIGVQWHPELLWPKSDYEPDLKTASQPIFEKFVSSCCF